MSATGRGKSGAAHLPREVGFDGRVYVEEHPVPAEQRPERRAHELDRLVDFLQALSDETFSPEVPAAVPSGLRPIGISPLAEPSAVAHAARTGQQQGDS